MIDQTIIDGLISAVGAPQNFGSALVLYTFACFLFAMIIALFMVIIWRVVMRFGL